MADLYEEIKEDLKQERFMRLWNDIKWYVLGGVIGVLVGTAGTTLYKDFYLGKTWRMANKFYEITKGDESSSDRWDALLEVDHMPIRSLGYLRKAAYLLIHDQEEEAVEIYQHVADDQEYPKEFRDLALLMLLYLKPDEYREDERLSESVWRLSADEYRIMELLNEGNKEEASQRLSDLLLEPDLPRGIRLRAERTLDDIAGAKATLDSETK